MTELPPKENGRRTRLNYRQAAVLVALLGTAIVVFASTWSSPTNPTTDYKHLKLEPRPPAPQFVLPTKANTQPISLSPGPLSVAPVLQTGGTNEFIHFDELGEFVVLNDHYPNIKFASSFGDVFTLTGCRASSPPRFAVSGQFFSADFIVTFRRPVNNLRFTVDDSDQFGMIALMDVYQKGVLKIEGRIIPGAASTTDARRLLARRTSPKSR